MPEVATVEIDITQDGFAERKLTAWRGKPIDELTREELVEAMTFLASRLYDIYTPEAIKERAKQKVQRKMNDDDLGSGPNPVTETAMHLILVAVLTRLKLNFVPPSPS